MTARRLFFDFWLRAIMCSLAFVSTQCLPSLPINAFVCESVSFYNGPPAYCQRVQCVHGWPIDELSKNTVCQELHMLYSLKFLLDSKYKNRFAKQTRTYWSSVWEIINQKHINEDMKETTSFFHEHTEGVRPSVCSEDQKVAKSSRVSDLINSVHTVSSDTSGGN